MDAEVKNAADRIELLIVLNGIEISSRTCGAMLPPDLLIVLNGIEILLFDEFLNLCRIF